MGLRRSADPGPGNETWHYRYDAFGRRTLKYNPNTKETIHYTWDGDDLAQETRLSAKDNRDEQLVQATHWCFEPGTFKTLAKQQQRPAIESGETTLQSWFIVTDAGGAASELFTPEGEVAWQVQRSVWGINSDTRRTTCKLEEKTDCDLRFAGQYFDRETGLHYNRFRYYSRTIALRQGSTSVQTPSDSKAD